MTISRQNSNNRLASVIFYLAIILRGLFGLNLSVYIYFNNAIWWHCGATRPKGIVPE